MRIRLLYFFLFVSFIFCSCVERTDSGKSAVHDPEVENSGEAEILFTSRVNDLGRINEGEQLISWFDYVNNGNEPLVISDIKAGCGCTVPSWNKEPLEPGKSGSIKVIFNSKGKNGMQNIRISVNSNAKNSLEEIHIIAIVENFN